MSIGTGIFLSALFLVCIVLYVKSENKAKWRKRILCSLAGLVAAGAIVFVGFLPYDAFEKYTETSSVSGMTTTNCWGSSESISVFEAIIEYLR